MNFYFLLMFDQQEQKLLEQALSKVRQQYKHCRNVYGVSAFDPDFDFQLKKLVLLYSFDFEAVALHLYFMFPQYGHRLPPQAVSYRWYQLTLEREGPRITRELQESSRKNKQKGNQEPTFQNPMHVEEEADVVIYDLKHKMMQYEIAMAKAQQLDEEEQKNFMMYKPKFIIDSEFKLERETTKDNEELCAMVENEVFWEFGSFEVLQAAPVDFTSSYNSGSKEGQMVQHPQEQEEQTYMDDDWEAYESD